MDLKIVKELNCPICGKHFESPKWLTNHLYKDHNLSMPEILTLYKVDMSQTTHRCTCCGIEYPSNKRAMYRLKRGETKYLVCSKSCKSSLMNLIQGSAFADSKVQEKAHETIKQNLLATEGIVNVFQRTDVIAKIKATNLKQYNAENPFGSKKIQEKIRQTHIKNTGYDNPWKNPKIRQQIKQTTFKRRGYYNNFQDPKVRETIRQTIFNLSNGACEYACQLPQCVNAGGRTQSQVNEKWYNAFISNGINVYKEFYLKETKCHYDFIIEGTNQLIEINPTYTHNSTYSPYFGNKYAKVKEPDEHYLRNKNVSKYGYECFMVWDWDDPIKVLNYFKPRIKVGARKCIVKQIERIEANTFLNLYHFQNQTKSIQYAYGLFYQDQLVEVMTFGKPRYNTKFEYELLRLSTIPEKVVLGGASKLFKQFIQDVQPNSIISYCDLSKFTGKVYDSLKFNKISETQGSRHWAIYTTRYTDLFNAIKQLHERYNLNTSKECIDNCIKNFKTNQHPIHITDNQLRFQGADRLLGTNYGKGTDNMAILLAYGYAEVYDAGQATYVWIK